MKLPSKLRLDQLEVDRPGAPPRRRDWILVAVLGLLVVIEVLASSPGRAEPDWPALALVPATVSLVVLPFRRVRPIAAVSISILTSAALVATTNLADVIDEATLGNEIAQIMLIYAVCRWAPLRSALGVLALLMAAVVASSSTGDAAVSEQVGFVVLWAVFVLAAIVMRYRARVASQQEVQIRLEERQDLAREVHDTVAHHVSAIAVQAQAAQFVAADDIAGAVAAMKAVEDIANTTIDEMRRMVGILRTDGDRARVVTMSISDLAVANGSPRVSVDDRADVATLPSPIAAAIFRIAQESVTNARTHSRDVTYVDIAIRRSDDEIELSIDNDGVPTTRHSGGGYGLVGMHERVEALNGSIAVGPRPASGWQVHVTIPVRRGRDAQNGSGQRGPSR